MDKQEIMRILKIDDFTFYDYYADDYKGVKSLEIFSNYDEADDAFAEACREAGIDPIPPLCYFVGGGAISKRYIKNLRLAKPTEYKELEQELKSLVGYNLNILNANYKRLNI